LKTLSKTNIFSENSKKLQGNYKNYKQTIKKYKTIEKTIKTIKSRLSELPREPGSHILFDFIVFIVFSMVL